MSLSRRRFLSLLGIAPLAVAAVKQEALATPDKYRNRSGVLRLVTSDEKQVEVWKRDSDGKWVKAGGSQ